MADVVIISMEDQPNGMVRVTFGTYDYNQGIVTVPKESLNDPGFLTMIERLSNQPKNIATHRKRSANPGK